VIYILYLFVKTIKNT